MIVAAAAGAAARDPLEAMPLLDLLPAGRARLEAAEAIGRALLKEDPTVAFNFANTFPVGETQKRLLAMVARGYAEQDPRAALQWLRSLPEGTVKCALVGDAWPTLVRDERITPIEAAHLARELVAEDERTEAMTAAIARLTAADTSAACAWMQQLPDVKIRADGLLALARNWPASASAGALAFARTLAGKERGDSLATLGNTLARPEQETAAAQIRLLAPSADRDAFIRGTVEQLSYSSPRAAAGLLDAMSAGTGKNAAAAEVVRHWATENPTAAAACVRERPDLLADWVTCSAVTRSWASWDAPGAAQWLTQLPTSPVRSAAAAALVAETQTSAPEIAASWLSEIADPEQRQQATISVARQWLRNDRANASAWLARSDLSRETIDALLTGRPIASGDEDVVVLSPFQITSFD